MRVFNQHIGFSSCRISFLEVKRLLAAGLLVLLFSGLAAAGASAQARDVYITPDGGGSGVCTNNTHPPSWFNSSGNWGSGGSQIGPGTIVHLCGTFTGAQNSTLLTAQGSGSSGNPVTILFESGTNLTSPAWSNNGALVIGGHSNIVVDGGSNGIIQNTNAGTNLGIHNPGFTSVALNAGSNNVTGCTPGCRITNLTVANMYVHVYNGGGNPDANPNQTGVNAVTIDNAVGIRIDHCTFHDMGWAISYVTSNLELDHNNIYNVDHGIAAGAQTNTTGVLVHDNHIHDFASWDTGYSGSGANSYHHDGLHFWTTNATNTNFMIYNNLFDGDAGVNKNAYIYTEGNNVGFTIFNNVMIAMPGQQQAIALIWLNGTQTRILNNTLYSPSPQNAAIQFFTGSQITMENNLIAGSNTFFYLSNGSASGSVSTADYNLYGPQGAGGNNAWSVGPIQVNSLTSWQSATGMDAHSFYASANAVNGDGTLTSNSAANGRGANLTGLGITALNSDRNGNARPSSGAWTIGAYSSGSTAASTPPAPPTNVKATVQ